ncbi:MAG: hypothetical protein JNK82_04035 [Myxococcaceae bacterium]|nr:hypothetical protein [Myxococcaceae bacterium]
MTAKVSSTKRERFLPWAWVKSGLGLETLEVTLDGERPAVLHADRHLVELDEVWQRAELTLQVGLADGLFEQVVAPGDTTGLSVVVALRCDETRLRRGERLVLPRNANGLLHRVTLRRDELVGSVELSAVLVRDQQAEREVSGFASLAGARLAAAWAWELRVDRKRALSGVYLDVRYRSFRDDPIIAEWERGNLYRLEADGEAPILWLNSDHAAIASVLDAKGQVGSRAHQRDTVYDVMVPMVWAQLFVHAATELWRQGEVALPWQDAVLDAVCALLEVERGQLERDELPTLLAALDRALQAKHHVAAHLLKLLEGA